MKNILQCNQPIWKDQKTIWYDYKQRISCESSLINKTDFPDFFMISPPKSGLSWLVANLKKMNPDINIPWPNTPNYFDIHWSEKDIAWYLRQFSHDSGRVKGDASCLMYMIPDIAIEHIHKIRPDLKLVFLLRNPIDRAWQHTIHTLQNCEANFKYRIKPVNQIDEAQLFENIIDDFMLFSGDYQSIVSRWMKYFKFNQIFIGYYEDVVKKPSIFLKHLTLFLDRPSNIESIEIAPPVDEDIRYKKFRLSPSIKRVLESIYIKKIQAFNLFLNHNKFCLPPWENCTGPEELINIPLLYRPDGWKLYFNDGRFMAMKRKLPEHLVSGSEKDAHECFEANYYSDLIKLIENNNENTVKSCDNNGDIELSRNIRLMNDITQLYHSRKDHDELIEFVKDYDRFNIFHYRNKYIALNQKLGPVNLFSETIGERELSPFILRGDTLESVQLKVEALNKAESFLEKGKQSFSVTSWY